MASSLHKVTAGTSAADTTVHGTGEYLLVKSVDGAGIVHANVDGTDADTGGTEGDWVLAAAAGDWCQIPVNADAGHVIVSLEATADTVVHLALVDRGYE